MQPAPAQSPEGLPSPSSATGPAAERPAAPDPHPPSALDDSLVLAPDPNRPLRLEYGDAVRVVGTLAVVFGHVCDLGVFVNAAGGMLMSWQWWVCNVVDSATRWAVPAYIMLSGALLLDPARAEPPRKFFTKRLARIGVPLVFWSAFFMAFSVYVTKWVEPRQVWLNLMMGEPYMHLHFIFRIAGLYAFTPAFRVFLRHCSRPLLLGTVATLLGLWSLDSMMNSYTGVKHSAFARWAPFVGYYLLGYYMRGIRVPREKLIWCWVGAVVCCAVIAGGTGLTVYTFHNWADPQASIQSPPSLEMFFLDFLNPVRVVFAILVWLIFANTHLKPRPGVTHHPVSAAIRWIAPTTLGLYLIHPMFRELFYTSWHLQLSPYKWTVWVGIPLFVAAVYVPSLLSVWLLMKVPYVRRIVS